ncbi:GNAT family N-acetyltransferase [Streptomyces sp. NPDC048290]|uniref:GNAT family N-acetyltransferase n=1 Tax=Streptomyces sp. NPDC048290 TaxID=3155811 RepID=UPI00343B32EE
MDVDQGASVPFRPAPATPATPDPSGFTGFTGPGTPLRSPSRGHLPACAVRPMEPEDLPFVVAQHRVHFPDGFFARLGPRYLTAYTRTYVAGPYSRAYIAEVAGTPVGFLVGILDPVSHREHVMGGHGRRLLIRAGLALSVRPALALHFVRTRLGRYARKLLPGPREESRLKAMRPITLPEGGGPTAVLSHVAVVDQFRSFGLGTALVSRFLYDARTAGCVRASLVTAAGPEGAGRYYERLGWRRTGETRTPEGRLFTQYEHPLT